MKLIFCKSCGDLVALTTSFRKCKCKKAWGHYKNEIDATYGGDAMPIGINNASFGTALTNQPYGGQGREFVAFVIPKNCETFRKLD